MSDQQIVDGGCQCGRIRYRVAIDDDSAYLCHCRMCRRATGGVTAALKQVKRAGLTWTTREPDRYASSPIAQRGFCQACGTPLTYEGDGKDGMDLTVGSFDDSGRFSPVEHSGWESHLAAWLDTSALPHTRTDENPGIVAAWKKAGQPLP